MGHYNAYIMSMKIIPPLIKAQRRSFETIYTIPRAKIHNPDLRLFVNLIDLEDHLIVFIVLSYHQLAIEWYVNVMKKHLDLGLVSEEE